METENVDCLDLLKKGLLFRGVVAFQNLRFEFIATDYDLKGVYGMMYVKDFFRNRLVIVRGWGNECRCGWRESILF